MKGEGPLPYPPNHSVGKGSHLLCFRGRLREGRQVTCPKSCSTAGTITQEYCTAQGQGSHCRAELPWWVERESAGGFIAFLSLDLDNKLLTHNPSPRLLSITALGHLITWSIQCSSARSRLGCSICPSSDKGPCSPLTRPGLRAQPQGGLGQGAGDIQHFFCRPSPPRIP